MALKKSIIKTQAGFSGQLIAFDAYWRIDQIFGNKVEIRVVINAYIKEEKVDSKRFVFKPLLTENNFIKQAYEHLKTLPEFAGATDC